MKQTNLEHLARLVDADLLAAQSSYRQVLAEEAGLRNMLHDLDNQEQMGRKATEADPTVKSFGGDVAWHRWISATRTRLNTQLAMVLARRSALQEVFQNKSGKATVTDQLRKDMRQESRRQRQLSEMLELEKLIVLRSR